MNERMVYKMKKILSLVLCFCFLIAAPLSIEAKTVTASAGCSSSEEVFKIKSIPIGNHKVKIKKGEDGSGLRFTAQKDGTYTFKFSNFKCKTDKDAGTTFVFWAVEDGESEMESMGFQKHITNFEKASASAKIKLELKKNQTIYISIDPSAQYIEDYELPMGGYLYKAFSFKLNIKRS